MYTKAASEASRSKHDDRNAENKVKIISTYRPGGELTVYTCHVCYVCLYKTRGGADVRQRDAVHDQEERRRVCPAAGGTYIFSSSRLQHHCSYLGRLFGYRTGIVSRKNCLNWINGVCFLSLLYRTGTCKFQIRVSV